MLKLSEIKLTNNLDEFKSANVDYKCVIINDVLRKHVRFFDVAKALKDIELEDNYYILDAADESKKLQETDIFSADDVFKDGPNVLAFDTDYGIIVYKDQASLDTDLAKFDLSKGHTAIAYEISVEKAKDMLIDLMKEGLEFWKREKLNCQNRIIKADERILELEVWLRTVEKDDIK